MTPRKPRNPRKISDAKCCAIYTRKSNEEGLEQAFNSLDAQRQAGIDYVKSQKHEGWQAIDKKYDDGGFTGGNMDRPALKRLLSDIKHGHSGGVDVVVVYKVDRLSRSLHDFARMMQIFDEHEVSFVSVTQQFNTTTSMGRLTLNMLLSFAQFEREVTGERIRDKLAATKKKGLWVGGQPPLGYRLKDRHLHIIPDEADLIRKIYEDYLATPSLIELTEKLNEQGHTTKRWRSRKGNDHGGRRLTPKYLHRILTNPLYIGRIVHKDKTWKGQHEPIIPRKLWNQVQQAIDKQLRQTRHRWTHPHLLKGKLRTHENFAISPGAVHRPASRKGEKRLIRYYVSQKALQQGYRNCPIKTINARHIDDLIRALVLDYLKDDSFKHFRTRDPQTRDHWLREMIDRVILAPDQLTIELNKDQIQTCQEHDWPKPDTTDQEKAQPGNTPTSLYQPKIQHHRRKVALTLALQIKRLDGKRLLLSPESHDLFIPANPEPKNHIVLAIGRAYHWHQLLLKDDLTLAQLAKQEHISVSQVKKILPLINLGPELLRRALTGDLPPSRTLNHLLEAARNLDWQHQLNYLSLPHQPNPYRPDYKK